MKVLVTGSAGMVGSQVVKDLTNNSHDVFAAFHKTQPDYGMPTELDLLHLNKIEPAVDKIKPDAIIHLAALTNVDLCETQKDLALKINAQATDKISKAAAKHGSFLVYVSTDYVFDGESGMKKENDKTNPVDFYGRSKLEGEQAVQNSASSWCIARTSTPYGYHKKKKSFPSWVAENLKQKNNIYVVTDQFTSPTYVPNLSSMLIEVAQRQITGTIHLAGSTRISRHDMATLVAETLNLDKSLINPVTMDKMKWDAKRPRDSSLDVSLASSILEEKPMPVEQGIGNFVRELVV